jgi:hypothetical protein
MANDPPESSFHDRHEQLTHNCVEAGLDVFLGRFEAATGAHLGAARPGGTGQENGVDVAEAPDGRLYCVGCVGHFDGFAEFGGLGHWAEGGADGFIVGLNPLAN